MSRRALASAVVAAAVAVLAGCGGGGSSSTTSSAGTTTTAGAGRAAATTTPATVAPPSSQTTTSAVSAGPTSGQPAVNASAQTPFTKSADAICKRLNAEVSAAVVARLGTGKLGRRSQAAANREHDGEERLSRLSAPASLAAQWREILSYRVQLSNEIMAPHPREAASSSSPGTSKRRLQARLRAVAAQAGFKECASVG